MKIDSVKNKLIAEKWGLCKTT